MANTTDPELSTVNSSFSIGSIGKYVLDTTSTQATLPEPALNGTGFYVEEDFETGLNDWETLFLSSFITVLPLLAVLFAVYSIRLAWLRYKRRTTPVGDDDFLREESSDAGPRPLHSHLLNAETVKADDAHVAIGTEDGEAAEAPLQVDEGQQGGRCNSHSNTNGSIITMTLKNNHLIVEKEERSDIEEDSRETKMKYSPNARDGVFVVEVQQGVRRSPVSGGPNLNIENANASKTSDQCALVHNPPERYSDEDTLEECDENDYIETTSLRTGTPNSTKRQIQTGLSQSDESISSQHNSYCYGNQQAYDCGSYGYAVYNGYVNEETTSRRSQSVPSNTKPKITSAVYKNRKDTFDFDPLLSDVQAARGILEENEETKKPTVARGEEADRVLVNGNRSPKLNNDLQEEEVSPCGGGLKSVVVECKDLKDVPKNETVVSQVV